MACRKPVYADFGEFMGGGAEVAVMTLDVEDIAALF
jgi:hypothetical protein